MSSESSPPVIGLSIFYCVLILCSLRLTGTLWSLGWCCWRAQHLLPPVTEGSPRFKVHLVEAAKSQKGSSAHLESDTREMLFLLPVPFWLACQILPSLRKPWAQPVGARTRDAAAFPPRPSTVPGPQQMIRKYLLDACVNLGESFDFSEPQFQQNGQISFWLPSSTIQGMKWDSRTRLQCIQH